MHFGCFTPLMQAHGFEQETCSYDEQTLSLYRAYVLLHERLVPHVRASAATAARFGLPIIRPLLLLDGNDKRGWTLPDASDYGPSLWGCSGARGRRRRARGRPAARALDRLLDRRGHRRRPHHRHAATLSGIPVYVRDGALIPSYRAEHVAGGLGDTPEAEGPPELTVWGSARHRRVSVNLADGTRFRGVVS